MVGRLIKEIKKKGNPIVVGLDPKLDFIPGYIKEESFAELGKPWKVRLRPFTALIKK